MNLEGFRNSPSGQVIRVGQGEAAYWAFIPHPLPPNLSPDWELARQLSEADRALSQLDGLGRTIYHDSAGATRACGNVSQCPA